MVSGRTGDTTAVVKIRGNARCLLVGGGASSVCIPSKYIALKRLAGRILHEFVQGSRAWNLEHDERLAFHVEKSRQTTN